MSLESQGPRCQCGNPRFEDRDTCPLCEVDPENYTSSRCFSCTLCVADRKFMEETKDQFTLKWCRRVTDFTTTNHPVEGWECSRCKVIICVQGYHQGSLRLCLHSDARRTHIYECNLWGLNPPKNIPDHQCKIHENAKETGLMIKMGDPVDLQGKIYHLVNVPDQHYMITRIFHRKVPSAPVAWNNIINCDGQIIFCN